VDIIFEEKSEKIENPGMDQQPIWWEVDVASRIEIQVNMILT